MWECARESVKSERVGFCVYACMCAYLSLSVLFMNMHVLALGYRQPRGLMC